MNKLDLFFKLIITAIAGFLLVGLAALLEIIPFNVAGPIDAIIAVVVIVLMVISVWVIE